jgi:hypothetical protein
VKARLSSTTALGPTGTRPGLGIEFAKTILSCQTLRRKSSNTWIVNCSPLPMRRFAKVGCFMRVLSSSEV